MCVDDSPVAARCRRCAASTPRTRNVAVFSTTYDDDYLFFTPLTALVWRAAMRYDTACVLVGAADPTSEPLLATVLNESLAMGVDVFWLASEPNVRDATMSQVAR